MPRPNNVAKVTEAIIDAYRSAGDREPTAADIIARSGVSSATYYRIVAADNDASAALAAAQTGFAAARNDPDADEDPIAAHPHAVVKELKAVIATLLSVIEDQQQRIDRLSARQQDSDNVVALSRRSRSVGPASND